MSVFTVNSSSTGAAAAAAEARTWLCCCLSLPVLREVASEGRFSPAPKATPLPEIPEKGIG